ncbi:MAG TPA: magnesium transporter [Candidatus Eubacterium faecavium]|nr:magnesium transporter [Candidatus Eubacterium faecavium]
MAEYLDKLHSERNIRELKNFLNDINPADIAQLLEQIEDERKRVFLFRMLTKENAAETFVEFDGDTQENLISAFSDSELKEVIDELYIDDAADIVEEMPASVVKRILKNTDSETRAAINSILKYPDDSAGSIMTTEFVDLKRNMTVEDAFKRIRRTGVDKETIYTCYVTDESRHLLGVTTVKELLLNDQDSEIKDLMETNVISVNTLDDQEKASTLLSRYDFLALPVVDMENRLVGIITVDDAMDVLQEENTEDIQKMAAIVPTDKPYLKTSVTETFKKRIPWLLLLMISATITSQILTNFENKLASVATLIAFIPMLMGTGGNSGGQSSVTVIRALSLDEISMRDIFKVVWKELRVGIACGAALAAVCFVKLLLFDKYVLGNSEITVMISLVVSLTIIVEVIFSKIIGCCLPIIAKKCGFDPAVMANPFITTITDAVSLLIYILFASALLGI